MSTELRDQIAATLASNEGGCSEDWLITADAIVASVARLRVRSGAEQAVIDAPEFARQWVVITANFAGLLERFFEDSEESAKRFAERTINALPNQKVWIDHQPTLSTTARLLAVGADSPTPEPPGDLICPNCGASASLPLGMTCNDHRPVLVRADQESGQ